MLIKPKLFKNYRLLILLFLPLIFLFYTLKLDNNLAPFNFRSYDPDYAYLISGVTIGSGRLDVGHIDHPGTPIQVIFALSTRIQHLVTGDKDYLSDVFSAPGNYIHTVFYVLQFIVVLLLIISGFIIYRLTKNIFLALFIQTSPFLYPNILADFARLAPDSWMIIPVLILTVYSIRYIQKGEQASLKEVIIFSVISGLGLSFKLTYISFWILPLVLFKGWKNKAIFLFGSLVAFLVFGFPVLYKFEYLINWIKDLFIHSGSYGKGEANIVEWSTYLKSIGFQIKTYWLLYAATLLGLINLVVIIIKNRKVRRDVVYRMLLGMVLSVIFNAILVSKHFASRYMYHILLATPFIFYLNFELITQKYQFKKSMFLYLIGILLGIYFIVDSNNYLNKRISLSKDHNEKKAVEYKIIIDGVKNAPFVIIPNNIDMMFEERGIVFGCAFARGHIDLFQDKLINLKPDFYLSEPTANKFWHWTDLISPSALPKKYNEFYLFVGKDYTNTKELFLDSLGCNYELNEVYSFEDSGNKLFLTKFIFEGKN